MAPLKVLISGGGIAGPAAALWLSRLGHSCTVLERFPDLRAAGQQVDIRGQAIEAVRRMGILEEFREHVVDEEGLQFVDTNGNVRAFLGRNDSGQGRQSFSSEYEIMRGDLCKILYNATKQKTIYRFGTSIDSFQNGKDKVSVRLSDGSEGKYDLVIAADGQGSRIRRTMFHGLEDPVTTRYLGLNGCFYGIKRKSGDENVGTVCLATGRRIMFTRWHSKDYGQAYLFSMADTEMFSNAMKKGNSEKKKAFAESFEDAGWQAPRLIEAMNEADDFYAEPTLQIRSSRWSQGRIVLLGDAGYAPSPLTGMGTSLALIGACVLSGEIAKHGNDVPRALAAYDETLRPFVNQSQKIAPGIPALAYPRTSLGINVIYGLLGLVTKLKIDKALRSILPEDRGKWRIPDYANLQ